MTDKKEFDIPFEGLKNGIHQFNFVVDDSFFDGLEYGEIAKSDLIVDFSFDKQDNLFTLMFNLKGSVAIQCERCLENYNLLIDKSYTLLVQYAQDVDQSADEQSDKFTQYSSLSDAQGESINNDSDIRFLDPKETSMNIHQEIYEYVHLSLPMRRVHPDDSCNDEALKILTKFSPENSKGSSSDKTENDPRWEPLKQLK